MITSFTIRNFRCFQNLHLEGLRRVNLILGANNTGKTSLLEALFLNLGAHDPEISLRLNAWRGIQPFPYNWGDLWGWLFYAKHTESPIELIAKNGAAIEYSLTIRVTPPREFELSMSGQPELPISASGTIAAGGLETQKPAKIKFGVELSDLVLEYHDSTGQRATSKAALGPDGSIKIEQTTLRGLKRAVFLSTRARNLKEHAEQFSRLKSIGRHQEVVGALQSVDARLRDLDILVMGGEPVIHGDIGLGQYVPLPMMGEGFNRILSVVLAIANSPGGVVLIDEVENGLHFSALEKLWNAIAEAAAKADVQVFGTTHSRECVLASLAAFGASQSDGLGVCRLQYARNQLEVVQLERRHLDLAAEMGLEIRA